MPKNKFLPVDGAKIYNALRDKNLIVMATNIRVMPGVMEGIFQAAKDNDSAIIIELASSECNLNAGYTGLTPREFSKWACDTAQKVGHDVWALHADHTKIKSLDKKELQTVEALAAEQIRVGYTSFAIDASFMFNHNAKTIEGQLADNIQATTRIAKFIAKHYHNRDFGLEVEVGEIGKKNDQGLVLTTPEEALVYLKELKKNNVNPQLLAIANGSSHGNKYENGKLIAQTTININQTKAVAKTIRDYGFKVWLAQHGTTGTPLQIISGEFPKGDILKCNVGTNWLNIVWEILSRAEPELYKKIYNWTITNYLTDNMSKEEIFGKFSKHAIREFFADLYSLPDETVAKLQEETYREAVKYIQAFNSIGSASIVRKNL